MRSKSKDKKLAEVMKQAYAEQFCQQPDRHEPRLKCGYPLPCPHHTVFVVVGEEKECGDKNGRFTCNLPIGHEGDHKEVDVRGQGCVGWSR